MHPRPTLSTARANQTRIGNEGEFRAWRCRMSDIGRAHVQIVVFSCPDTGKSKPILSSAVSISGRGFSRPVRPHLYDGGLRASCLLLCRTRSPCSRNAISVRFLICLMWRFRTDPPPIMYELRAAGSCPARSPSQSCVLPACSTHRQRLSLAPITLAATGRMWT